MNFRPRLIPVTAVALIGLTACGGSDDTTATDDSSRTVMTSIYPLDFITTSVAADHLDVVSLTPSGVDPHDVELSPQTIGDVQSSDLVIYSADLQTAIDEAVEQQASDHSVDVNGAADLISTGAEHDHDHGDGHEEEHEDEGASDEVDPHWWLDPARMADVTQMVSDELSEIDPDNAADYESNAAALIAELDTLDGDFEAGLANCEQEDLVTTHAAFGYLAENYGFHQIGVTGISPEAEPSPARLAEVTTIVEDAGVDTIYSEVILGSDIADTIANETGATVLKLDPLEGLTDASAGSDYLEVMRSNLDALTEGQHCS